jgi:hypothetical protein
MDDKPDLERFDPAGYFSWQTTIFVIALAAALAMLLVQWLRG